MPNYSLSRLTTVADCDALEGIVMNEVENLNWKKLSLQRQKDQYEKSALSIEVDLLGKQTEKDSLNAIIAALPEGALKDENITRLTKVEFSIFLLKNRKTSYGEVAFIEKEYELQRIQHELDESAVLMNEVRTRRTTI